MFLEVEDMNFHIQRVHQRLYTTNEKKTRSEEQSAYIHCKSCKTLTSLYVYKFDKN